MKETTLTKDVNRIIIVAFAKFTSIVEDIIEIENSSVFKGNVKRDINRFIDFFNHTSRTTYNIYYKDSSKFFEEVISNFDDFSQQCDVRPECNARMMLIYSKLLSMNMDLYSITVEDNKDVCIFARFISAQLDMLLSKKFWNMYKAMKDPEGNGVEKLTERIHSFGRMIYMDEAETVK